MNLNYCIFIFDDQISLTITKINKFNEKYWSITSYFVMEYQLKIFTFFLEFWYNIPND